jgi:signal transduction histidine kinase
MDEVGAVQNKKEAVGEQELKFKYLPAYAEYLLNNKLEDYVRHAVKNAIEMDIPILRFFKHLTEEQMLEMSMKSTADFFNVIINNNIKEYVRESVKRWAENQLPSISRDQVVAEDITMGTYLRKQGLMYFLPLYAPRTEDALEIVREIDRYHLETESASFHAFMDIQQEILTELNISLEHKNRELERINDELSSFTYIASHDLKEPLRKIKTFSNRVLENDYALLSEKGKDFFERILTSSSYMQKLIDDLLSYSHTTTYDEVFVPVDMNIVLEGIKITHKELIDEGHLIIESPILPIINGIPFQLQQLLENLANNSVKYSKPGTPAIIKISSTIEKIKKSEFRDGTYYKIIFEDYGIGFEQKYSNKIFEVFQRLHEKNEYPGTGIGLAICKKIVENHNGYISAIGKPDEGAIFTIYLPC